MFGRIEQLRTPLYRKLPPMKNPTVLENNDWRNEDPSAKQLTNVCPRKNKRVVSFQVTHDAKSTTSQRNIFTPRVAGMESTPHLRATNTRMAMINRRPSERSTLARLFLAYLLTANSSIAGSSPMASTLWWCITGVDRLPLPLQCTHTHAWSKHSTPISSESSKLSC